MSEYPYYLEPNQIAQIGERLLAIPHVRRLRYASKGLAVCPTRVLDPEDAWVDALIHVTNEGRKRCKNVALHTHINHPNEITWVTRLAAQMLFQRGVTMRNQAVLLRGVNNDVATMKTLTRDLADLNIQPVSILSNHHLSCRRSSTLTIVFTADSIMYIKVI